MRITFKDERFIGRSNSAQEGAAYKKAGFRAFKDKGTWWWHTKFPANAERLFDHCDTVAQSRITLHRQRLAASRATDSDMFIPVPAGLEYRPFQRAGIAFASQRKATLIADEMGLGKTIQGIGLINWQQYTDREIERILIVCPASLQLNWRRELEKWLVAPNEITTITDNKMDAKGPGVYIATYNRMSSNPHLQRASWDQIIVDEVQQIKNPKAKRSEAVAAAVSMSRYKLFLTGTPMLNKPIELQPIISLLDPDRFGNYWQFARRYCDAHKEFRGRTSYWVVDGCSNEAELQERLRGSIMVRRLKRDVLTELPPKVRQIVPIEGVTVQIKDLVEEDLVALKIEVDALIDCMDEAMACGDPESFDAAWKRLQYLIQVDFTQMSEYRHKLGLAKVPATVDYCKELLEGGVRKLVVFAHHKVVQDTIAKALSAYNPVRLTGDMSKTAKQRSVDAFQNDPNCRVFVGSILAAGVGLTLTEASHEVFCEMDWVPANNLQAEDRCHRMGQRDSVNIYQMVADGTLDARIIHAVVLKQAMADAILDNESDLAGREQIKVQDQPKDENPYPYARKPAAPDSDVVLAALRRIAGACDGAQAKDNSGFNGFDASFGQRLAALARLTDKQSTAAKRMLRKYHRQLGPDLCKQLDFDAS